MIVAKITHAGVQEISVISDEESPPLFEDIVFPLIRYELRRLDAKLKREIHKGIKRFEREEGSFNEPRMIPKILKSVTAVEGLIPAAVKTEPKGTQDADDDGLLPQRKNKGNT